MNWLFPAKPVFEKANEEELSQSFENKNILIIGGTAGIGRALAIECLKYKAKVTVVGRRTPDDALSKAKFVQRDLSSMKAAASLADDVKVSEYDAIVFTNGILCASTRQVSSEGIELDLAVSALSRYAFLKRALKSLKKKPRVFVMGFPGKYNSANLDDFNSEKEYKQFAAHMNTVVLNEALVHHYKEDPKISIYGLNPGLIRTEIRQNALGKDSYLSFFVEGAIGLLCKSAESYAKNVLIQVLFSDKLQSGMLIECDGTILPKNTFLNDENIKKVMTAADSLLTKAQ
jgi:NAD(P)-dependent dehydrogenase (short-subunit alcohol dehydrogenase family)